MSEHARVSELRRMRDLMGTSPRTSPPYETRFYHGVEGIRVQLLDGPVNPYKAMYCMAVSTWGAGAWSSDEVSEIRRAIARYGYEPLAIERRWDSAAPEMRFAVVNSVLGMQALPLALEHPKFMFGIENLARWAFDQIVRARLGVVYASMGTRDNCHLDMAFRMHEATYRDVERRNRFVDGAMRDKEEYRLAVEEGRASWQEARTSLRPSIVHRFCMSINYAALRTMCAKRMSFSEAEDVVAVAWLLRDRLQQQDAYPLLARWLRPRCDFAAACGYHRAHTMSEAFGCLYKSCGRNPVKSAPGKGPLDYENADFNEACSDRDTIRQQLGIWIPEAGENLPSADDGEDVLTPRDRYLFGYEGAVNPISGCRPSGTFVEPAEMA